MAFLKNMEKMLSANHKLVLVGLLLLTLAIGMYSNRKGSPSTDEGMRNISSNNLIRNRPRQLRNREGFRQRKAREGFEGNAGSQAPPPPSSAPPAGPRPTAPRAGVSPQQLLPSSNNNPLAQNPTPSLLSAGHHQGLDTVGQTLRNANQQLRADPVIPRVDVGPFLNSTIEGDTTGLGVEGQAGSYSGPN